MAKVPYLSPREEQVLWLLSDGLTNKEIARTMGISFRTVEVYTGRLRMAFSVHTRGDLMVFVKQTGWKPTGRCVVADRNAQIAATVDYFRKRIETITADPHWRHPNLAAVSDRLCKVEDDLLLWSKNMQLASEALKQEKEDAMAETIEPTEDGMLRIIGKPPSAKILAELEGRIGPDEAAVVVSAETVDAYLASVKR